MSTVPAVPVYDVDRTYLSRLSHGPLLLRVLDDEGNRTTADGPVTLTFISEVDSEATPMVFTAHPVSAAGGTDYRVALSPDATAHPGPYVARWSYVVNGEERVGEQPIMIGESSPAYDGLSSEMRGLVESVWVRIADMFDSPMGGPHLQVYVQSKFGRGRIADLLPKAIGRLNIVSQPHQTYSVDRFPVGKWGALLELALWIEVIKHMRRSYAEQPDVVGTQVARLDRQRYMQVWGDLLRDEEADFRSMLDHFKIASMNLGTGSVLVSGGIYPRVGTGSAFASMGAPRGLYIGRSR